jgi:hypothetical protein
MNLLAHSVAGDEGWDGGAVDLTMHEKRCWQAQNTCQHLY